MGRPLVSIVTPVLNRVETIGACLHRLRTDAISRSSRSSWTGDPPMERWSSLEGYRPSHPFRGSANLTTECTRRSTRNLDGSRRRARVSQQRRLLPSLVGGRGRSRTVPGRTSCTGFGVLRPRADGQAAGFNIFFYPDFDLRHYSFVGTMGQPTVFWRRSLTEAIGLFDTRYRLIGDCEYWLRAALAGATLHHVPEIMAVQVEHGSTLRATQAAQTWAMSSGCCGGMTNVVDPPRHLRWYGSREASLGELAISSSSTR